MDSNGPGKESQLSTESQNYDKKCNENRISKLAHVGKETEEDFLGKDIYDIILSVRKVIKTTY